MHSPRGRLSIRLHGMLLPAAIVVSLTLSLGGRADRLSSAVADEVVTDREPADMLFLPPDRKILQRFGQSRELLAQQRYAEAVRYLGSILDGPEDYFFQPDKDSPIHRSLRGEAQRLIGSMPRKGRELYELQYGPQSRRMLTDALAAGDMAGLAEVSRRFFHTTAGREATLLLGLNHLDQSRPLAAALMLRRLKDAPGDPGRFEPALSLALATGWLRSGNRENARQTLLRLKVEAQGTGVELGGRRVSLPGDDDELLGWLERQGRFGSPSSLAKDELWAMVGGNPARNAAGSGAAPLLNVCWNIPTANDSPLLDSMICQLQRNARRQGAAMICGLRPLAVDDRILMRTACNLVAVDFATGRRQWQIDVEDDLETFLGNHQKANGPQAAQMLAAWLRQRVWNDATYGSLSSDGRCVFTIGGLGVGVGRLGYSSWATSSSASGMKPYNRLSAHDVRTGKLRWRLGGEPAPENAKGKADGEKPKPSRLQWQSKVPRHRAPLRLAGTFFLGPPLPLMGRLYVLGEREGEIRLLVLDAGSGDLLWSQQLAIPRGDILREPFRRTAGVSPSYADGILVCPTSAGAVVAVDMATRSLLWGYRYQGNSRANARRGRIGWSGYGGWAAVDQWRDANPVVSHGRVLITPGESDLVHCLDLRDGKLLWTLQRDDDLYLACVHREKVVFVGSRSVRAVSLFETETQSRTIKEVGPARVMGGRREEPVVEHRQTVTEPLPAWGGRSVDLPDGCMPSGRGFLHEDKYFLPVDSAQVVAIDLQRGAIAGTSNSREGAVPGNLICYKNRVISQGGQGLDVFHDLASARSETQRRLNANPDSAADLALHGAILLDEGNHADAVAALHNAYRLDADPETRTLLRDAMFEGLRVDFPKHRELFVASEDGGIESLLDEPSLRAEFLRLMATGLHDGGQWDEALDHYLRLADDALESGTGKAESGNSNETASGIHFRLSPSHSVRRDVWIGEHLGRLHADADEAVRRRIDDAVRSRREAVLVADEADRIARLESFVATFGTHGSAAAARRELVRRLTESGQGLKAELYGLAEKESFEKGPAEATPATEIAWPQGHVDVKKVASTSAGPRSNDPFGGGVVGMAGYGRFAVTYEGPVNSVFADRTIRLDGVRTGILCSDGLGRDVFEPISLIEDPKKASNSRIFFGSGGGQARVVGHALLVAVGHRIVAVDTLGSRASESVTGDKAASSEPNVLWSLDLSDERAFDRMFATMGSGAARQADSPLAPNIPASQYYSPTMGSLAAIIGRCAIIQRYRALIALDVYSGKPLWIRRNVPPGAPMFGDDRFLFVLPPGKKEAIVLRTSDGRRLGKRPIRPADPLEPELDGTMQLAMFGRMGWLGGDILSAMQGRLNQVCLTTIGRQMLVWRKEKEDKQSVLELFDPWHQRTAWAPRKFSLDARVAVCGHDVVGVMEPDGSFVLLATADGRTIARLELKPEETLEKITLARLGDQLFLVTSNRPEAAAGVGGFPSVVPDRMPGTLSTAVADGRVYAMDPSGRLTWDKPVEIRDQHFLLNQPARLPLLTFACKVYRRNNNVSSRMTTSLLCLDRRTGRKVFEDTQLPTGNLFAVKGDPDKKTVMFETGREKITLTLTDKPIGSGKAEGDEPTAAGAALKALGKALIESFGTKGGDR